MLLGPVRPNDFCPNNGTNSYITCHMGNLIRLTKKKKIFKNYIIIPISPNIIFTSFINIYTSEHIYFLE